MVNHLAPGSSSDAAGWCHESVTSPLDEQGLSALALTELLRSYATLDCGSHAQDFLNMSVLIPLRKNDTDAQVRPRGCPHDLS